MSGSADDKARERLLGTWTLVSALREEIPSGATRSQFGEGPRGRPTNGCLPPISGAAM